MSISEIPIVFATGTSGTIGRQLANRVKSISFRDFCQDLSLPRELNLADATVVHMAGIVGARAVEFDPLAAREVNVSKTLELAKICMGEGARRFVYVSSAHVYEPSESPINEDGALGPESEYAKQKLDAEERLRELAGNYDSDLVSLRLFSVLSLDGKPDTLGARVAQALESKTPLIVPFAQDTRDFLSPKAYADLILQIASKDSLQHKVINVGSGQALSVGDAVRRLLKSANATDLGIELDNKSSATPRLVADNSLLRQVLGIGARGLVFP